MINFAIKLAATVALEAMQMGLQASKRTTGPRLDELKVTVADYGTPIPRFLGERRFSCPIFHAEDLKETEQTTKVKGGGKQTTYHYLGTFACAIADNAIDKVLKVWFDGKLVYDTTAAGPTSALSAISGGSSSFDLAQYMRVYTGTETQLPDPRYVSWCEAKYGPNSAPAYRGVSYLFFEDLPLDNFGNRIPQVEVMAVSAAAAMYPYEQKETAVSYTGQYAFGGNWLAHYSDGSAEPIEWWDVPTRALLGTSSGGGAAAGTVINVDLANDGTAYFFGQYISGVDAFSALFTCPPLGAISRVDSAGAWFSGPTRVFDLASGVRKILTGVDPSQGTGHIDGGAPVAHTGCARDFCLRGDGGLDALYEPVGSSNQFTIRDITGAGADLTVSGLTTRGSANLDAAICHVSSHAHYFVATDGHFYLINDRTTGTPGTIKASGSFTVGTPSGFSAETINLPRKNPDHDSFWSGYDLVSLVDGSIIQRVDPLSYVNEDSNAAAYDAINDAIWTHGQLTTHETIRYLNRAGNAGTTLGAIISKMCDAAGLTSRDTSALTQSVLGYSWTRGDVKSQMEPVLDIHDVDARPHDFSLQFLPRGSAPSGTILTQDMVKNGDARYKVTTVQDTDLPKMLRINFADNSFDQQTNNVLAPLPADAVDSQRDDVIDLTTYADTPAGAQQKADRYLRRRWNSRQSIDASVTAQSLAIEPGDVTTISLDGISQNVRLEKQAFAAGRIDCTFVRDETSFAAVNSASTGPTMARVIDTIYLPPPVVGFVVDAPYRQDSDADIRPIIYAGAGTFPTFTFPGSVIYQESSGAYDVLFAAINSGATWGFCSVLATANANLWDRGNRLTVTLEAGMLTSVTEADINADPTLNLVLVGQPGAWEYLNFTTATLVSGNTYTLSGFKRGRRGTEWAVGLHATGDVIVFPSALEVEEMGSDDVGNALSFKAQAVGRSVDSGAPINLAPFTGASLKPYAPANVIWLYDGTNLIGTITRRTRVGGAWNGATIPLGEATEAYEVDIYNGATFKRTIALSGTNVFTYTAAMAAADGITLPARPTIKAYQLSAVVGRGFALAA